jgi:hypothetical protein
MSIDLSHIDVRKEALLVYEDMWVGSHKLSSGQTISIINNSSMVRWKGIVPITTSLSFPVQMLHKQQRLPTARSRQSIAFGASSARQVLTREPSLDTKGQGDIAGRCRRRQNQKE